ncbi:MAG: divalent-cation tolerance protein CutA [Nitrosomonas sp.]|nr:divalent-cation tolerance protein CutA [Nitrosomonas sp.]
MTNAILVITNFPDNDTAAALAQELIDTRLAACINIMSACTSVYRWQSDTETAEEHPVFIKTQQKHYNRVEQIINAMHPYELPEILVVPVTDGLPAYLQWIIDETT